VSVLVYSAAIEGAVVVEGLGVEIAGIDIDIDIEERTYDEVATVLDAEE